MDFSNTFFQNFGKLNLKKLNFVVTKDQAFKIYFCLKYPSSNSGSKTGNKSKIFSCMILLPHFGKNNLNF